MSPTKEQQLFDEFPYLYRAHFKSAPLAIMLFGFECEDGWFDLVWGLSQHIEVQAKSEGLDRASEAWPEVLQVKEKLGTLRFYMFNVSDSIYTLINMACIDSASICEICGLPGTLATGRCVKAVCAKHAIRVGHHG